MDPGLPLLERGLTAGSALHNAALLTPGLGPESQQDSGSDPPPSRGVVLGALSQAGLCVDGKGA